MSKKLSITLAYTYSPYAFGIKMNLWESLNEGTWLIINKTTGRNAAKTDMEEQNYRNWTCEWRTVRSNILKIKYIIVLK